MRSRLAAWQKKDAADRQGKLDKRDDKFAGTTESSKNAANPIIGYLIVHTNAAGKTKTVRCQTRKNADAKWEDLWQKVGSGEALAFMYVYMDRQTWQAKERIRR